MPRISLRSMDHVSPGRFAGTWLSTVMLLATCFLIGLAWSVAAATGGGEAPGVVAGAAEELRAALSCCTAGAGPPSAELHSSEEASDRIYWVPSEPQRAAFIPESVLNEKRLEELPLSPSERYSLEWQIEAPKHPATNPIDARIKGNSCVYFNSPPPAGSDPDATDLAGLIERSVLAVFGKVVEKVPGWSPSHKHAASMIHLQIEGVLRAPEDLQAGDRVGFVIPGETTVHGSRLCTYPSGPSRGFAEPELDDRLLLIGRGFSGDQKLIEGVNKFPIQDGLVLPQPYAMLREQVAQPLAPLVKRFRPR